MDVKNAMNATSEPAERGGNLTATTPSRRNSQPENNQSGGGTPGSQTTSSHLAKLTPKPIVIKERRARDFFGRVIEVIQQLAQANFLMKHVYWSSSRKIRILEDNRKEK